MEYDYRSHLDAIRERVVQIERQPVMVEQNVRITAICLSMDSFLRDNATIRSLPEVRR